MSRHWPSTIRLRLTALYAGAFFLAGTALIALTYLFLQQALDHNLNTRVASTQRITEETLRELHATDREQLAEFHRALRAQFEQERDDTLRTMLTWSLVSLGVVGVAAGGCGWLLAGRALHPLQRITATARRVADHSLHERIALQGPADEIRDLADTFDAMLERLDRSFDGQRRFVANASHELRTPLTINRTLIEVTLDDPDVPEATRKLGTALLEVNDRHERLIDGLLTLASSDQDLTEREPVDLADAARQAITVSSGTARTAGVEIRSTLTPATFTGDPVLLERLVQNLLDNAIRYNTTNGWTSITTGTTDGYAYVTVENTGPIIGIDEIDELFEPFRRLGTGDRLTDDRLTDDTDPIGRGAGLGLSIVRAVTHAHNGHIHTAPRPGGGLTIQVRIPNT
ncbi:MAG: HAMP domain-containing protein [Streptosporangiales bacterium]|nr:HAMP domain-containing protein [Streptosporangiales bacterium]